jgi:hypothetical protein
LLWGIGRYLYAKGYQTGNPEARYNFLEFLELNEFADTASLVSSPTWALSLCWELLFPLLSLSLGSFEANCKYNLNQVLT